ncbi:MAG: glutathione S-transferase family protein [Rhodospirillales bacterium]|nr:glutathione S-transferase family protein [Rhodospirillales bacterium]MDP7239323.1 glutathione S-transferase family protein [Candidatus Latescibacterota bacterium]
MIELYHFWDSPCCFKVRTVLAEKNLDWQEHLIASVQFDHFQPEYQAINPHSIVPSLIHDGHVLMQSGIIAEYLDETFPENPLTPKDPVARATMRQWAFEEQAYLFPLIVTMSFNLMMTLREKAYGMDQLREWSKRHPDQARAQDYLNRISSPLDQKSVDEAGKKFTWYMARLEKQFEASGGPWVCGETYSLADISLGPILDRIDYLDMLDLLDGTPKVVEWYRRMTECPAFKKGAPLFEYRMWGPKKPIPDRRVGSDEPYASFPSA